MSDLSDLNSWWLDHINLSSDRGYPSPEQAARAAWEHQQAKVKELEGDVTHLTSCQSELTRQREVLKRDNAIINAEWERSTGVWQEEVSNLKAQVEELTKLVASLEEVRAQEYAFKQAKVDDYKTMFEGMKKSYESNAARVIALEAKVEELEAQLSMHSDIDRLVVRTIKKLDELDIVKEEGE